MPAAGITLRLVLTLALVGVAAPRAFAADALVFQTTVAATPDEDLSSDCHYELTLPDPSRPVSTIWIVFDRGRDMLRYYGDSEVQAFAARHGFALLLAFHCPAKSFTAPMERGDINPDPSKGLGRALLAGITQLSAASHHAELASAKLILIGFSGAGSLVARLTEYAPDRVAAVIAANAGHFDPYGMDTVQLSPRAAAIPQLILVGSQDGVSGVVRPYAYFRRYFDVGAPWTFVVQNQTPHCCVINAKALILEWLDATVVHAAVRDAGFYGFISIGPSATLDCPAAPPAVPVWCRGGLDHWGGANWSVAGAAVERRSAAPEGMIPSGWMPNRRFAKQWKSFVTQPTHPVASLP